MSQTRRTLHFARSVRRGEEKNKAAVTSLLALAMHAMFILKGELRANYWMRYFTAVKAPKHIVITFVCTCITRRCGSLYMGVAVLRVWYFVHAILLLNNCHHILPEKVNPLLHLFAEPHSLYSMSTQSTTKIVSFQDNVWKYGHLQCRHAWNQIAT